MPVKTKQFGFPIFLFIFVLYCIVNGLPNGWEGYGFIALVLDLIINPLYKREEVDY